MRSVQAVYDNSSSEFKFKSMGIPFQTFQGSNCSNGSGGLTMSGVIGKLTSENRGTHEKGTGQFWESSAQADDQSTRAIAWTG
jgi:hypothetical protein